MKIKNKLEFKTDVLLQNKKELELVLVDEYQKFFKIKTKKLFYENMTYLNDLIYKRQFSLRNVAEKLTQISNFKKNCCLTFAITVAPY